MLTAFLAVIPFLCSKARNTSLGSQWSFKGIALTYSQKAEYGSFHELYLSADMTDLLSGNSRYPGVSAAFSWNIMLKEWELSDEGYIRAYAGPGAAIGWTTDKGSGYGVMMGILGKAGLEYISARKIALSVSISPVLGCHTVWNGNTLRLELYKYGLTYSLMPEVGIKYYF